MDSDFVFNRLVGAYCGPLVVVKQFPKALSKLTECVQLTGLEIVRSICSSNDKAKYLYFQDFDRLATLLQYNLEHHLLDSLRNNDNYVSKFIENSLEDRYGMYPKWFRYWCATLATILRIERHRKYNIALERNGVFIFYHKDDDLSNLSTTFNDYKEFPLGLVYMIDGNSTFTHSDDNDNMYNNERDKESKDNEKEKEKKEKEGKEGKDEDLKGNEDKEREEKKLEGKDDKDKSEEFKSNDLEIKEKVQQIQQKVHEEDSQNEGNEEDKDKKEEMEKKEEWDEETLKELQEKKKKDRKRNELVPEELFELICKYNVKYHVIDTTQDFCNSSELIKFVDDFVDFCFDELKSNFESVNSSLKGMKISSKILKSPEIDKTMSKLIMLVSDELFLKQDTLIVNFIKSSLEHEILALSQFLYGVYLYRYKKHQPKSEARHEGELVLEDDGKIFIDAYTSISHFDKSIALFNKYSLLWDSFFISILSTFLGDYEEINKLLSKNSLLELKTECDYGRSAICLELSSIRCTKSKKKKFQLMMAGRLYNQASLINLSKRCYLSCLEEYEDWDIANEHLYSLLGDFDNNYLVNSLNILSNNYENKYSSQRSFEDHDKSIDDVDHLDNVEKGSKEIESNSEKELYYLRKLMKLNGFQMGSKYLVNTPISGSFENYPTIYYQQHQLPLVEGETPFLVRIPILYLRKNGIIGTNVKLTTSYVDDLYEKLFENSFKDSTWQKCIKFDSIKDHVKKDFFTVSQASRGANYMVDTRLNLSIQLLNPLNITVDCYQFKILVMRVNPKPGSNNKYQQKKRESKNEQNVDNSSNLNEVVDSYNNMNTNNNNMNNITNNITERSSTNSNMNTNRSDRDNNKDNINNNNNTNIDLKWVECDIKTQEGLGFQLKEFEKKNLLLTFRAQDVGSFKVVGLCWKLFDRIHFWSPIYTVGNKLKNYEFTKKITLTEFVEQRAIDKTLYFNVYEDRPKVNYFFKKVSDLTHLRNCVYFLKKDFEFVNNDNLVRFYTEKYSIMTSYLDVNKSVDENENLCLFNFFNGESSLIELSLNNLQDLPLSSLSLRFKVLGTFKTAPYPVGYKLKSNYRSYENYDYNHSTDNVDNNNNEENSIYNNHNNMNNNSDYYNNNNYDEHFEYKHNDSETSRLESCIECTWNVINLPNVKVKEESLSEKIYEVFMRFKDDNFTLYNHSLSIYLFLEPLYFLEGVALIDGSFGVVPQTGLDLLVPFKLFLQVKKGPSFTSYYDYKEVVKVQVNNRSKEEITQLDFTVNEQHVYSTDSLNQCSTSIPSHTTMNFMIPIQDPVVALTNTKLIPSERMSFSVFWSTLERFGVFNGYVEFVEYKLLVKLAASPKVFKSSGDPAVVDLLLTLQNLSSENLNSLSVSPLQDYENESLVSYIGETRKSVDEIEPGSSVSLFYQIVLPLPGIYNFSPLSFKLDTNLDEKNVNYQDHVNTVIVYD